MSLKIKRVCDYCAVCGEKIYRMSNEKKYIRCSICRKKLMNIPTLKFLGNVNKTRLKD